MSGSVGERLTQWAREWVPDPFVLALGLTLVTLVAGAFYTDFELTKVLWAWLDGAGQDKGFWNLLRFGMQMCLILVTGHAIASSPPVHRGLQWLAAQAHTPQRAVTLVAVASMLLGLINWGFGLVGGALLAREVGLRAKERGVAVHYPLLAAAAYTAMLVWHGGFSGSAPLKVTLLSDLERVLGAELAQSIGPIPLSSTVASWGNILVNGVLLVVVPLVLWKLHPSTPSPCHLDMEADAPETDEQGEGLAQKLETSPWLTYVIAIPGLILTGLVLAERGVDKLDPNIINFGFLWLGMLLHCTPRNYVKAVGDAAGACSGVILQFPFYAGIMGIMQGTGLVEAMARGLSDVGSSGLPAASFYAAGLVNLFVPSGGGQWAVQGPILMQAAQEAGLSPARLVMALSYGDQWTNMLQPFWALPLLSITGVRAKDLVGFTAMVLVVSQVVFLAGLYLM